MQVLYLGNTGGPSEEYDLIDLEFADFGILQYLGNSHRCIFEKVEVEFLEFGMGDGTEKSVTSESVS